MSKTSKTQNKHKKQQAPARKPQHKKKQTQRKHKRQPRADGMSGTLALRVNKSVLANKTNTEIPLSRRAFSGMEKVSDVLGHAAFTNTAYTINAGNYLLLPKLAQEAKLFKRHRFTKLSLIFKSLSANATSTGAPLGDVIMATNFDPTADDFKAETVMQNFAGAVTGVTSADLTHHVHLAAKRHMINSTAMGEFYTYYSNNADPPVHSGANNGASFYTPGTFQIAVRGQPTGASGEIVGQLFASYEGEFIDAYLPDGESVPLVAQFANQSSVSQTLPFGLDLNIHAEGHNDYIAEVSSIANTITPSLSSGRITFQHKNEIVDNRSVTLIYPTSNPVYDITIVWHNPSSISLFHSPGSYSGNLIDFMPVLPSSSVTSLYTENDTSDGTFGTLRFRVRYDPSVSPSNTLAYIATTLPETFIGQTGTTVSIFINAVSNQTNTLVAALSQEREMCTIRDLSERLARLERDSVNFPSDTESEHKTISESTVLARALSRLAK